MDTRNLFFITLLIDTAAQVSVVRRNEKLTQVPQAMGHDVTSIDLNSNEILGILKPDFNDQYPLLAYLNLSENNITFIEVGCFRDTILEKLNLKDNFLTRIPDLREIKATLKELSVYRNAISVIKPGDVGYLANLTHLNLRSNSISSSWVFISSLPSLDNLDVQEMTIACCPDTALLKGIPNLASYEVYCSSPKEWEGQQWRHKSAQDLLSRECAYIAMTVGLGMIS